MAGLPTALRTDQLPERRCFIDAKVAVAAVDDLEYLQDLGFRIVDTNVRAMRGASPIDGRIDGCRFADPADESSVRRIAADAFTQSRFHLDPHIAPAVARRIKSEWAGNFFHGKRGDWMIVVNDGRGVAGFLQLLRGPDDSVVIDLIAVEPDRQRSGFGASMIAFASQACLGRPAAMTVGTQIANTSSLSLYTRLGFRISSAAYVLHLHHQGHRY